MKNRKNRLKIVSKATTLVVATAIGFMFTAVPSADAHSHRRVWLNSGPACTIYLDGKVIGFRINYNTGEHAHLCAW